MTRLHFTKHARIPGLITDNSHIAMLIIHSFGLGPLPLEHYQPYRLWKKWLRENPRKTPK